MLVEAVIVQFRPVKVLHRNVTALIKALKVIVETARALVYVVKV